MPFMDGRTATRALRSRAEFALLPIIGVTALTLEHQKRLSAEAGFSDQIGKPYDSATFYRMLAKWIPKSMRKAPRAPEESAQPPEPIPVAENHVRSLRGVEVWEAIDRLGGKEDRYIHWLADFVATAGAIPDTIRNEIAAGFPGTAAKRVQAFKACVGALAMTELHDAVVALNLALRNGIAVDRLLAGLERSIVEMSNEVTRALGKKCAT